MFWFWTVGQNKTFLDVTLHIRKLWLAFSLLPLHFYLTWPTYEPEVNSTPHNKTGLSHCCTLRVFPPQAAQLAQSLLYQHINETSHECLWLWERRIYACPHILFDTSATHSQHTFFTSKTHHHVWINITNAGNKVFSTSCFSGLGFRRNRLHVVVEFLCWFDCCIHVALIITSVQYCQRVCVSAFIINSNFRSK